MPRHEAELAPVVTVASVVAHDEVATRWQRERSEVGTSGVGESYLVTRAGEVLDRVAVVLLDRCEPAVDRDVPAVNLDGRPGIATTRLSSTLSSSGERNTTASPIWGPSKSVMKVSVNGTRNPYAALLTRTWSSICTVGCIDPVGTR